MRTGGAKSKGARVQFDDAQSPEPSSRPCQTPATSRLLRPLNLLPPGTGGYLPLFSPGSAAGTPQLFTQRKSLFSGGEAAAAGGSGSPGPAGQPTADDRVKVVVRIRPPNSKEAAEAACLQHTGVDTLTLLSSPELTYFTLDHVAGASSTQLHMFKVVGRPIVDNVLDGYNSTIFAYGQTGAGKTYTMLGQLSGGEGGAVAEEAGLIPRTFIHLFDRIAELEGARRAGREVSFTCSCSMLEIYKEQLTDLLSPAKVALREDKQEGVFMEGLSWHPVSSADDVLRLLSRGAAGRHTAATRLNDTSSRSHMVMTCSIEARIVEEGTGVVHRRSKLSLVDLAGSERQKGADTGGDRLKEAQAINKSLFTLGQVIKRLTEGPSTHVPYRESKLTLLLRESLGGNSRTVIISTVAPTASCFSETASTLKFAQRAKQIRNNAVVNEDVFQSAVEMAAELQRLRQEVVMLRGIQASGNTSIGGAAGEGLQHLLANALEVSAHLEARQQHLQDQLTRLRQERDSFEAASKAAQVQLQILEEAEGAAEERSQVLSSEVQRLQLAYSDAQAAVQQQAGELKGLSAEAQQRAADHEAAAAALSGKAAALSKAEHELELARAQLKATSASLAAKEGKLLSSAEMKSQIASLEATYAAVNQQMERLMARTDALVSDRDQLRVKVQDLEVRAVNADTVVTSSREQIATLRADRAAYHQEAQQLANALAESEAQKQVVAKRNGELSLEVANHRTADAGIHRQLDSFKQAVAAMKEELCTLERSKAAAAARAVLLETQLQEHTVQAETVASGKGVGTIEGDTAASAQVERLRQQLTLAKEASMSFEAQAVYEKKHRDLLQKEHARLMQEKQQLEHRHDDLVSNLKTECNVTACRLAEASTVESQLEVERSQLAQQLDQARSEVDILENAVSELRHDHAQQAAELAAVTSAAATREREAAGLRTQLAEAQQEHTAAQARLQVAVGEQTKLAEQLEVLRAQSTGADARLAAVHGDLESVSGRLVEQEAALTDKDALVRQLRAEARDAATELEQLRATINEVQGRIEADLQDRVQRERALMAAISNKEAALEQLTAQAEEMSRRLQEVQSSAQSSAAEAAQLQDIQDVKSDRLAALEAEADVKEQRLQELGQQVAVLRAQREASRAQAEEGQQAAGHLQQRMAELEQRLSEAHSEVAFKRSSNEKMSRRAAELMRDLAASMAACEDKDGTINGLEGTVADLDAQLLQRIQQEGRQALTFSDLQQQIASFEELAAGRQAELQSLTLQLEAAEEALVARTQQSSDQLAAVAALQTSLGIASATSAARENDAAELLVTITCLRQEASRRQVTSAEAEAALQSAIGDMQGRLAAAEEDAVTAAANLQSTEQQLRRVQQQLKDAEQGLGVRTQQLQAHEAAVADLAGQLAAAKQQLTELATEAEGHAERAAALAGALAAARLQAEEQAEHKAQLEAELQSTKQQAEERGAAVKAGTLRGEQLEARAAQLAEELAAAYSTVQHHDGLILDLEQQLSVAENQVASQAIQLEAGSQRVTALEEEMAAIQQRLANQDKDLEAKDWHIDDLLSTVSDLKAEVASKVEEAAAGSATAAVLSTQLGERTAELEAATRQVEELTNQATRLDSESCKMQSELEASLTDAMRQAGEHAAVLEAGAAEVAALQQQLAERAAMLCSLEGQLSASSSESFELRQQLAASIAAAGALEQQLETAQQDAAMKAGELAASCRETCDVRRQLAVSMAAASELEQQLAAAQQCSVAKAAELAASEALAGQLAADLAAADVAATGLAAQLATAQQEAVTSADELAGFEYQLCSAQEGSCRLEARLAELTAQLHAAEADAASKQSLWQAAEQKLQAATEAAVGTELRLAGLQADASATEERLAAAKQALQESKAGKQSIIHEHLSTLRAVQEEVAALKAEADKTQREKHVLKEGLFQATADSTEQREAFQSERAELEEALGVLRAQVAQLQAVGATKDHQLQAATSRLEDLQQQMGGIKGQAASTKQSLAVVTAQLAAIQSERDATQTCLAGSEQEVAALRASEQQLRVQLRQQQEGLQQQLGRLSASAAQKDSIIGALERERDGLQADQQQLMQAVLEQQEQVQAALALHDHQQAEAGEAARAALAAASPAPPSVDFVRALRDQKEALKAQHEATVADMKGLMTQEVHLLGQQLVSLQRERDHALAEQSFAREEARVAATSQERALAGAAAAQHQLQSERDAVMSSLSELQAAFHTAEGKRATEMRRLKQAAEAKQREVEGLRAQLEERAAHLQKLSQPPPQQTAATVAAAPFRGHTAAASSAPAESAALAAAPTRGQQVGASRMHRRYADMEEDVVQQRSADSRGSSQAGAGESLPLQPMRLAQRDNGMRPHQQGGEGGGWGAGYEKAFQGGLSPDSTAKLRGGDRRPQRGLLPALPNQRFRFSQDENKSSKAGVALPTGQRMRLPTFNVDRYDRFSDAPSSS